MIVAFPFVPRISGRCSSNCRPARSRHSAVNSESQPQWHAEVLPDGWGRAAADLSARSALSGFYLAGGTGLALWLGHRRSVDLDLFSEAAFESGGVRDRLRNLAGLRNVETAPGTVHLELHDVKVSFLHYPYPLLFPLRPFDALSVADPRDIACMKLDAVANRGSRRDFIDLYLVTQSYGLREVFKWFGEKYAAVPYNRTHLFKSLTYFRDAEEQPMPDMLIPLAWDEVRNFFRTETPRLMK